MKKIILLLIATVMLFWSCSDGEDPLSSEELYSIEGTVYNKIDVPVSGVKIIAESDEMFHETTTDENGHYTLENIRMRSPYILTPVSGAYEFTDDSLDINNADNSVLRGLDFRGGIKMEGMWSSTGEGIAPFLQEDFGGDLDSISWKFSYGGFIRQILFRKDGTYDFYEGYLKTNSSHIDSINTIEMGDDYPELHTRYVGIYRFKNSFAADSMTMEIVPVDSGDSPPVPERGFGSANDSTGGDNFIFKLGKIN